MKLHTLACAAGCLLAPAVAPVIVHAQEAPQAAAAAGSGEALRVVRDPVSGKLRAPTAKEAAAARAKVAEPAGAAKGMPATPVAKQHANGMRSVVLSPQQLSTLKAERRADGSLHVDHDTHAHPAPALPLE